MIAAFIQARLASTRLPGKVLKPILGKPMLELQIERVRRCRTIDKVIVVTSTEPEDKAIVNVCESVGIAAFCGSLDDVMERFYQAAVQYRPDHIVRLTADCPLIDPAVVDRLVELYQESDCDFATNCMPPTYPDGLDSEIFPYRLMEEARNEAVLPSHREHVTVFFEDQPDRYRIVNLKNDQDLSHMRWTVDESEDFELIKTIFEALYIKQPSFLMSDVLHFLQEHPGLDQVNSQYERNEGLMKSREQDAEQLSR